MDRQNLDSLQLGVLLVDLLNSVSLFLCVYLHYMYSMCNNYIYLPLDSSLLPKGFELACLCLYPLAGLAVRGGNHHIAARQPACRHYLAGPFLLYLFY